MKKYHVECTNCSHPQWLESEDKSGSHKCEKCEEKFRWELGFNAFLSPFNEPTPDRVLSNGYTASQLKASGWTDAQITAVAREMDDTLNNGGKTDCYQLSSAPFPINDFDDFAEWRGLNGNQFNMGKAVWTFNTIRHSGTDYERDLNKIIHYANREKLRLKREKKQCKSN